MLQLAQLMPRSTAGPAGSASGELRSPDELSSNHMLEATSQAVDSEVLAEKLHLFASLGNGYWR